MLKAIAKLAKDILGHIIGVLGDEIDPHPLGADQPRHLFHLVDKRLGRVIEQQMRLVKEEHQLGFVHIPHLGQRLEQLAQQPEQESRIKARRGDQFIRRKDVDIAAPIRRGPHQILKRKGRLAKEMRAPLILEHQKRALDRPDRRGPDIAKAQRQIVGLLPDPGQQRLKVLHIQKRHALFVGHAKGDVQHALLRIRQPHQP